MSRGFLDEQHDDNGSDNDLGALDVRDAEITARIVSRSAKAMQIDSGDRKLTWVPLSLIRGSQQASRDVITLRLPEWWAKKNGLI